MRNVFFVFIFSLFFVGENMAVPDLWIVPEKKLTAASGLSDETRLAIGEIGSSQFERRGQLLGGNLLDELIKMADQTAAENPVTEEMLETTFNVQISQDKINGVGVYRINPQNLNLKLDGRLFVHIHGGAYFQMGGLLSAVEGAMIASSGGISVISVDYTLSTSQPFPAALDDIITVYKAVNETLPASRIGMGGSSAGGGLALSSTLKLKSLDIELPGALFAGTPSVDLLFTGDSWITNEYVDNVLVTKEGLLQAAFKVYAGAFDPKNPLISPLYGDVTDFPPTYLIAGTRDALLSDTVRMHRKLREAGVTADLNIFEGLPHGAYLRVPGSREYDGALGDLRKFLEKYL